MTTFCLPARPALAMAAMLLGASASPAQTVSAPALKAAFVNTFAKFAAWPADALRAGPLTFCVLGDDAVADALEGMVKGQAIHGHDLLVSRVRVDGLRGCHVLYMSGLDPEGSTAVIDQLQRVPVLTVGDSPQFAPRGGMVGLLVDQGKIRFEINVEAAQRARVSISSKLLSVATLVKEVRVAP